MSTSIAHPKEDPAVNIRLRRLNSATSSNYTNDTTLPPYPSTTSLVTNPFLSPDDDASSITSAFPITSSVFQPTHSFQIQAEGKKAISFPLPPKQLSTTIYSIPLNTNFLDTTPAAPTYISIRPERKSGSCTLVRGGDESETAIASTTYTFGPGKPPRVWLSSEDAGEDEEFEIVSKSLFSRAVAFTTANHGDFQWRYASKKEKRNFSNPAPNNLLLLERGKEKTVIARLIRSDETRTEGSKASCAGNGGLLEMCVGGEREGLVVIVTCLVMLKKEIDRLRGIQIAVMTSGGGGGGG